MINILNMEYEIHQEWCKDIYKKYIKSSDKVLVLPFSYRESQISNEEEWDSYYKKNKGIYYNGIVDSYKAFGISEKEIVFVNYYKHHINEIISLINESDVLYLPGGLPTSFYDKIVEKNLLRSIKQYKGVVIGCSAGAMIQLDKYFISKDKDYKEYTVQKGLGVIVGFGIEAHFSNTQTQLNAISRFMQEHQKDVYAIGDKGMIVMGEDNKMNIYGDVTIYKVGQ